uniref:Uncharacterized protein n=1 Tax=Anguilla anguilla TaxID=7936 RepID=A0A0E9QVS3_ANGAN
MVTRVLTSYKVNAGLEPGT